MVTVYKRITIVSGFFIIIYRGVNPMYSSNCTVEKRGGCGVSPHNVEGVV